MYVLLYTVANAQRGPGTVIVHPTGQDVELLCNVTGGTATWKINGTTFTIAQLFNGALTGHNISGRNIIVENIMMNDGRNGTVHICVVPQIPPPDIESDPIFLYIVGIPYMHC